MPYHSEEVANQAKELLKDSGMDVRKAAMQSELHRTVIYDIFRGDKVSETTLRKFVKGLGAEDSKRGINLLIAAGFEQPSDPVEILDNALKDRELSDSEIKNIITFALNKKRDISEEKRTEIDNYIRKEI
ncbi:MAG: hypothetical protein WC455_12045 [Dehalococcoidia bacterium]|jgi:predicted transcriptional regulator